MLEYERRYEGGRVSDAVDADEGPGSREYEDDRAGGGGGGGGRSLIGDCWW